MAYNVQVADNCTGCGECVDACPVNVYELENNKSVPVNAEECIGCMGCVNVCPVEAITVEEA